MIGRLLAAVAAVGCGSLASAAAAQVVGDAPVSEALPPIDDHVRVDLTPDLWGLSMKAKGRIGGQAAAADIPLGKIIDHLDNLFLGEVDVRKGHLVALADFTHAQITLPGSGPLAGYRLPLGANFLTLAAGWSSGPVPIATLAGRPVFINLQPFVGVTYDAIDVRIEGAQGTLAKLAPNWWAPLAGSRVDIARGRSSFRLEGYVGGFTDKRSSQQALVSYAYRLHWHALGDPTLGGGYRYSRQFRSVDGNNLAVKLQGPVVYMSFRL